MPFMPAIERRLREAAHSDVATVRMAAEHILSSSGKLVRPRFAALAGALLGSPVELTAAIGAAVELVHTATLLHDDLIDRSDLRRGRPSVHAKFGAGTAVLAGDFFLTRALESLTAMRLFAATHEMSLAVRELVEAELLQLERAFDLTTRVETSRRIAEGKTGALFAWCVRAQAVSLDLPAERVAAADRLGRTVGYAFQVADDLLDLGDAPAGKPTHKDLHEGQLSMPVQLARRVPVVEEALTRAFHTREDGDFARAYQRLHEAGAVELGRAELGRCRAEVLALAQNLGAAPEALAGLGAYFDAFSALAG